MLVHLIDTRPGAQNLFAAPAADIDYYSWLMASFERSIQRGAAGKIYTGISQAVNAMRFDHVHNNRKVIAVGPFAEEADRCIGELTDHQVSCRILT